MHRRLPLIVVAGILVATGSALAQPAARDAADARARAYTNPAVYAEQKAQWMARLQRFADNVDILEGAADFFILYERPLAQQLFEQARSLEPNNPRWPTRLAALHRLNAESFDDPGEARLALTELERARAMTPAEKRGLPTDLPQAAFAAGDFAKARLYAEQLLQQAAALPRLWDYGNAVHKGNLALGRLAVREGLLVEAGNRLRASGAMTAGSPQLNSFGPNMTLAKDLLELGETEAVLDYFESCRAFWKMGGSQLDAWTADVKAGRMPNFGANLRY